MTGNRQQATGNREQRTKRDRKPRYEYVTVQVDEMSKIMDYKDLVAWQKGRQLVREVYRLTNRLPKEEMYAMSSQIHRSAISIPANIAEGSGRNYLQDYIRFLRIARGSCYELETQLILCEDLGYFSQEDAAQVVVLLNETQKLLIGLLQSLEAKG